MGKILLCGSESMLPIVWDGSAGANGQGQHVLGSGVAGPALG